MENIKTLPISKNILISNKIIVKFSLKIHFYIFMSVDVCVYLWFQEWNKEKSVMQLKKDIIPHGEPA